ncbi:MAG: rod shape-determining protein MreC [Deltaproteobacteria bacterium]|nr:rod shape-determining protein MreC [Deltaproteobacteria bacterium]
MGHGNTHKILLAVFAIGLVLILLSLGQDRSLSLSSNPMREGFSFFGKGITLPFSFVHGLWTDYVALVNTRQENKELRKELQKTQVLCMTMQEVRSENERLSAMLGFKSEHKDFQLYPARLLGQDITNVFKTVIVDRGSRNKFFTDMPVVSPLGLVGRVITTSPHTSQVLLITDPNSAIPAIIEETRVKGVVKGAGTNVLNLEYVRSTELVQVGSTVVTSGLEGIFPKGMKIGVVREVNRDPHKIFTKILVAPSVEMSKIEGIFGVGRNGTDAD